MVDTAGLEGPDEDIRDDVAIIPPAVKAVVSVVLVSLDLRLVFDALLRDEGVSRDSLALGSSSLVYRPMDGLLITYVAPTSISQSSPSTLKK